MKTLNPSELDAFARRYRWAGGRLSRVRFRHRRGQLDIDLVLRVRTALKGLDADAKPVRLQLRFVDVEECRFQKRRTFRLDQIRDAKFGFFEGMIFATFDSWSLSPGERPALHDFRGTEAYFGAKDLLWQELPRRQA